MRAMQTATDSSLSPFFDPQGVVVIGVSLNPAKLGYGIAQNLVNCGYKGAIHFVNPKGGTLFERPVYADVNQVPPPADLAVLLVPAAVVPATLQMCGERGVRAAVIASGGFREVGAEGAKLEAACLDIARQHGMRLMGPNCIGLMDTHLPLDTTFLPPTRPSGGRHCFHLSFRRHLRGHCRLVAGPGVWLFAAGQLGKPGGRDRNGRVGDGGG